MKLSYRQYPILRFADKQIVKEYGYSVYIRDYIQNPKNEEERYINEVSKLLYLDGMLTNKPIYISAVSFTERVCDFAEKAQNKDSGDEGDSFYTKDGVLYMRTDFVEELEECIIITPSNLIEVHHKDQGKHYFIGFSKDGVLLGYCMLENEKEHIYYDRKDGSIASTIEKGVIFTQIFKNYGEVELIFVESGTKKKADNVDRGKVINELGVNATLLDSRWFREIIRTESFKVSGHFRLQPYKNEKGEWTKKLIYINEFEKHGYHRRAKIEA